MAKRPGKDFDDIEPVENPYIPQEISEAPFLITASELRERKNKRRKKHNAPRP
jgi:hypothetical protein